MSAVIETEGLTKIYEAAVGSQAVVALDDVSLTVEGGEIFGYLGPNGSGKTTTIKLLLGLIFPTNGTMRILGSENIGSIAIRKKIGYLPEGAYYPEFLKGEEVLEFYGKLYGLGGKDLKGRIDRVMDTVGLAHARKRLIRGYSKGMRQRIGLAQALISDPEILILDEPTTGLDPIARKEIRDILVQLRDQGTTLFISSHELLEVELISNRVGILHEGKLAASGRLNDLLTRRDIAVRVEGTTSESLAKLGQAGIAAEDAVGASALLRVPETVPLFEAIERCKAEHMSVVSVSPRRETLEELFVRVVGGAKGEGRGSE